MYDVYSDVNRAVWCGGWVAVGPAYYSMVWRMGGCVGKLKYVY